MGDTARDDRVLGSSNWGSFEHLVAMFATQDVAMFSLRPDGKVTSWNPGAELLLGWSADQMIGQQIWLAVPPGALGSTRDAMKQALGGDRARTFDTRWMRADGTEVDVAVTISLLRSPSGDAAGYSVVMRDITARKQIEAEQQRLLAESTRRGLWLEAISEVRLALVCGEPIEAWSRLVLEKLRALTGDDDAILVIRCSHRGLVRIAALCGEKLASRPGTEIHTDATVLEPVLRSGERMEISAFSDTEADPLLAGWDSGTGIFVPICAKSQVGGVLGVLREPQRHSFNEEEIRIIESFAEQAALGVELARSFDDRSQLELAIEQERIARDIHDHVIQRLFALGMSLQALASQVPGELRARVARAIDDLDAAIRDVRTSIFSLQVGRSRLDAEGLRNRVLEVANGSTAQLGFTPRVHFEGPVDAAVPEALVPDVLAVVREALSNVARHAKASSAEVTVSVIRPSVPETDQSDTCARSESTNLLEVVVSDDGMGIGTPQRSSGLRNLRQRAEHRKGSMKALARTGGGTELRWRVPIPDTANEPAR